MGEAVCGFARRRQELMNAMTAKPELPDGSQIPHPRKSRLWIGLLAIAILALAWRALPGFGSLPASIFSQERAIGAPFSLLDTTGKRVTDADLTGNPYAIFFGYTHCPDVCPTTLSDMTGWLKSLGPDADKLRLVFVTVDPARDTVAALAQYMKAFDPRILALTGSEADIAKMLTAYRVYAKKTDEKNADYGMDHTAAIYLMTATGDFRTVIGYDEKPDAALARLKDLISGR